MNAAKITISLDEQLLDKIDRLVKSRVYLNRSHAVRAALEEKIERLDKNRLRRECAKLDSQAEQEMADAGLSAEISQWPEY